MAHPHLTLRPTDRDGSPATETGTAPAAADGLVAAFAAIAPWEVIDAGPELRASFVLRSFAALCEVSATLWLNSSNCSPSAAQFPMPIPSHSR